ncbi:MAG: Ig-like domain-containing protein [Cellulosilyticaceae bacterium]
MSAVITGIVFDDTSHSGIYTKENAGIANVCMVLQTPTHTLITTLTNHEGHFTFDVKIPGKYVLYELGNATKDLATLPSTCPLLFGYTGVTTPRAAVFSVSLHQIHSHITLDAFYFGYDYSEAFSPTADAYYIYPKDTTLYTLNLITGISSPYAKLSQSGHYSCVAYDATSHYLYGYEPLRHQIFRITKEGFVTFYTIPSLPQKKYTACAIDAKGLLYLYLPNDMDIYIIQLDVHSPNFMQLVLPTRLTPLVEDAPSIVTHPLNLKAWAFHPHTLYLYGITEMGTVLRIDAKNGSSEDLITTGTPLSSCTSLFFDYAGVMYCLYENANTLYRISTTAKEAIAEVFCSLKRPFLGCCTRSSDMPLLIHLGTAPDLSSTNAKGNYSTTLANNGPRHPSTHTLRFASDASAPHSLPSLQMSEQDYTIELPVVNRTGKNAFLYGWIDFNQNGVFEPTEACEVLSIPSHPSDIQTAKLAFALSNKLTLSVGETYCRFRLTTDTLSPPTSTDIDMRSLGVVSDGQVLDCPLSITGLPPSGITAIYEVCFMNEHLAGSCTLTDPCHGTLVYTLSKRPSHGLLELDTHSGKWRYTPKADFVGDDTFNLQATSSTSGLFETIHVVVHTLLVSLAFELASPMKEMLTTDVLSYTLRLKNKGTIPLTQLMLQNLIPFGCVFVPHSATVNGLHTSTIDLEKNFTLEELLPSDTYTLTYQCELAAELDHIATTCTCQYTYKAHPDATSTTRTTTSSAPNINVFSPHLVVDMVSDTSNALVQDTIYLTLKLSNVGTIPLTDIRIYPRLDESLTYQNDLALDGELGYTSFLRGYTIPHLAPDTTLVFTFSATIKPLAHTKTLSSFFKTEFAYTVNHQTYSSTQHSDKHLLKVHVPPFTLTKTPSKIDVSIGEVFTYTYTLKNESDLPLMHVVIQDVLPAFLEVMEVASNDGLLPHTLSTGIPLPKVGAHHTESLVVHLKVLGRPDSLMVPSMCEATFNIQLPDTDMPRTQTLSSAASQDIFVSDASLVVDCLLSTYEATIGESITYTLTLTNTGTVALCEILIQDLLSPELKFVPHSVIIGQTKDKEASLISGITLKNLEVNTSLILSFEVVVIAKVSKEIDCSLSIHYTYGGLHHTPLKTNHLKTSMQLLQLHHVGIEISGSISQDIAFLNDCIDYALEIHNTGDTPVFNISLTNDTPSYDLLDSSFKLNNHSIHTVDLKKGINLGSLESGKSHHIQYTEKISHQYYPLDTLTHTFCANYSYSTCDNRVKYGTSDVFTLSIPLALCNFKCFEVEGYFELPDMKPDFSTLHSLSGTIHILKHSIIQNPVATSSEGLHLTSQSLIVHGILELTTEYVSDESNHTIYSSQHSTLFSTYIVLPEHFPSPCNIRIHPTLQVAAFRLVNNRSFFASTSILAIVYIK